VLTILNNAVPEGATYEKGALAGIEAKWVPTGLLKHYIYLYLQLAQYYGVCGITVHNRAMDFHRYFY
jgi:hypothetical protein